MDNASEMTESSLGSSEPPADADQPSLLSAVVRRRKHVVLATALVVAFATAAFAASQTKLYAATASLAVQNPLGQSTADAPNMATEQQSAQALAVAQSVRRQLNLKISASSLLSHLSVGVPVNSNVLTFTYSDPSARNAQIRANAFANAYLALRQTQLQHQVRQSQAIAAETSLRGEIPYLATQLSNLQDAVSSSGVAGALASRVNGLTLQIEQLRSQLSGLDRAVGTVSAGSVIGSATLPRSPTQPKIVPYTIIGLFLGLLLGFAIAAALERFDDRLRDPGAMRASLGAPVLGVIPQVAEELGWRNADAFRRLQANVAAAASDAGARSILVTSIDSGDERVALVRNLGAALAAAGNLVVVVLARQLDPLEDSRLQLNGGPGFTDALAGTVPIHDTLRPTGSENLFFCSRGAGDALAQAVEPDPDEGSVATVPVVTYSDLLASDRAKQVMEELTRTADYVLVDAPPVQLDADAYLLAGACDGMVAVATLATTTRRDVGQASDQLGRAGARLLGSVLLDPEPEGKPAGRWAHGAWRTDRDTNRKAHAQPANNGAVTDAAEA